MPSKKIITPIIPGNYYHIFNRGNNYEKVFFSKKDYQYFLKKYRFYLTAFADTYAYALLPNHYHFLLRVKANIEDGLFSKQFKLFKDYTAKINKREKRSGNLFLKLFRRLEITSNEYFQRLVFYIHYNPQNHEYCSNFKNYEFSSYKAILSDKPTSIKRSDVIEWFGGIKEFISFHNYLHEEDYIEKLIME